MKRGGDAFHLRPYTAADEAAAIALWHATWQQAYPSIDFDARLAWWRERWRSELVPRAAIVVAESASAIVGFMTIDASGYLDQIVVASSHWGTPLADALLEEARKLSPSGVTLKVNADNARAIRFYERNGFVHDGNETNANSGRDVWRMAWRPAIIIRDATPTDAAEACDVLRRSISELCTADHHDDPKILSAWLENKKPEIVAGWIARPDNSVLLAIRVNAVAGVGSITEDGEIQLNYVSPSARFRGVSDALLKALEHRARDRGVSTTRLVSTETAHGFYQRRGYLDTAKPEGRFGTNSSYPMSKSLAK